MVPLDFTQSLLALRLGTQKIQIFFLMGTRPECNRAWGKRLWPKGRAVKGSNGTVCVCRVEGLQEPSTEKLLKRS